MNKYILTLLLLLPLTGFAESETTVGLERDHPKANMKYLYGSVIRTIANISDNTLVMNMMTNVQLIVYGKVTLASVELAKSQFKQIIPSLLNEQYYEVIRLDEKIQFLSLSELFDEFGLYALKTGDHISAIFIFRRQAQKLEFLDISGVLERTKLSTSDISSLYKLLDTLNKSDLLNFTEVEDDT